MPKDKADISKPARKNTSLRLDGKTLKALKLRVIEEDTSIQRLIERLIDDYLKATKKKGK
ncbi:hypothetical protein [Tritonibacter sp. SIMBA_163]|uniref:hypothetical protein n=1 Tax=Tritonibacter sp. SIMBA_163 TaxID=3080868 RepID=UPI003980B67F